ncbi:MAG: hypothetical protein UY41_C0008G0021 [Candidatus Moranbacteria bacterium GW2011_GWE1_49_15]|nr:MAG: hypothetical protein UX75_C0008G0016 [Candidatus Moranbacteria bacterium GW2011_GWE2_47_10]KKW07189.1 MAG: hypothetical protein UY41_C0008G0021 [Candidatus Moranbacteria bacterium GW2011_GWE1_49_15]
MKKVGGVKGLQKQLKEVFAFCVIPKRRLIEFMGGFIESHPGQYGRMDYWKYGENSLLIIIAMPEDLGHFLVSSITEGRLKDYPWEIMAQKI